MSENGGKNKNVIIGTAGHIDHGKTTLINALTGSDTDRLKEEKERGISIDLGFTDIQLADNIKAGIIDVPGHEKFVKNMLAGAGGVDVALLVIAADEGVMPQTKEHLSIMELLEVKQGVIAVTKIDMVEDDWLELVISDIRDQLAGSFLADAPLVRVSGQENVGLDKLQDKLLAAAKKIPEKDREGNLYMPVDRVFTLTGYGTIVTGTLIRGTLHKEANVMIYPDKKEARIRNLQVHNQARESVFPGERVGVNLAGLDKEEVDRGDVLATPDTLQPTSQLDARLQLLESAPLILEHDTRIRFHIGAREVIGKVYLIDKEELLPGEAGLVQFRLEEEVAARYLESYVIRRFSPMVTIGGGKIIETSPPRRKMLDEEAIRELEIKESGSPAERIILQMELTHRPIEIKDLVKETHFSREKLKSLLTELEVEDEVKKLARYQTPRWLEKSVQKQLENEILQIVEDYHKKYPLRKGIGLEELRTQLEISVNINELREIIEDLETDEKLEIDEEYISLPQFSVDFSGEAAELKNKILEVFRDQPFTPPDRKDLQEKFGGEYDRELIAEIINSLEERGILIRVTENIYFLSEKVEKAREWLMDYLHEEESIELSEFRDMLASTRKYTLPLLEYFDQKGITERRGDKRYLKE